MAMLSKLKNYFLIFLLTLIPTLLVWTPFFLRISPFWSIPLRTDGLTTIVSNYDGPLYIVVAKTLYNKEQIKTNFSFPIPTEYYAAHFPLFPFLIRIGSLFLGFPHAMLAVTIVSAFLALLYFYKYASDFVDPKKALLITLFFSIFPARWLVVRSVGSPEPLFVAAIIASLYYFKHKKYWLAAIWGVVAQFTKSPAILLFLSYGLFLLIPVVKSKFKLVTKIYPLILMPIALMLIFLLYSVTLGDFLAYFHSGDNVHLYFPPFQIFNYSAPWVGTFWLEEIIYIYLFGLLGIWKLIKNKSIEEATFVSIFFFFTIFISHRDLARYSLPIAPFIIAAFCQGFGKKEILAITGAVCIPIFLFSLAYINQNTMPISNWLPFL